MNFKEPQRPICLFDSGIGGFTVLRRLIDKFPNENYIYLADLARVPYGDKKESELKNIVLEIIEWLLKFKPKMIIMACNASSAIFNSQFSTLSSQFPVPVYGMIESCAKEIAKLSYSKVSIWATKLVVDSGIYKKLIQKINSEITVEEIACPKLVPMIENLSFTLADRNKVLSEYLHKTSHDSQALVLGCTHYPLIQDDIESLTDLKIIDPAESLIKDLKPNLISANSSFLQDNVTIYTTDKLEKIQKFSRLYLGGEFKCGLVSLKKMIV